MVEPSKPSAKTAKKSTGKTEPAEPEFAPVEALQILNKALKICRDAGVNIYQTPIYDAGEESAGIIIRQARWAGEHLEYTGKSTGTPAEKAAHIEPKPEESTGK